MGKYAQIDVPYPGFLEKRDKDPASSIFRPCIYYNYAPFETDYSRISLTYAQKHYLGLYEVVLGKNAHEQNGGKN